MNYINAHATSTPAGDLKEYQALMHCFGQNPEVSSFTPVLFSSIVAFCKMFVQIVGIANPYYFSVESELHKIHDWAPTWSSWCC